MFWNVLGLGNHKENLCIYQPHCAARGFGALACVHVLETAAMAHGDHLCHQPEAPGYGHWPCWGWGGAGGLHLCQGALLFSPHYFLNQIASVRRRTLRCGGCHLAELLANPLHRPLVCVWEIRIQVFLKYSCSLVGFKFKYLFLECQRPLSWDDIAAIKWFGNKPPFVFVTWRKVIQEQWGLEI